jgi:DNA integrity scanning protein DisA with diadenylate cyclase activity
MRNYIYKVLIAVIALIVLFEFTIGKTINKISSQTELVFTKEGRKGMISSIKVEMEKAVKKENYLDEDERILINKFIKKIKDELKSAE